MLLDQGDHRSILTLYSAQKYLPNYPSLPLQAVAETENLLDFSRARVLEVRFGGGEMVVADAGSSLPMLRLPLAPGVAFSPNASHAITVTALRDSLWKFERMPCQDFVELGLYSEQL